MSNDSYAMIHIVIETVYISKIFIKVRILIFSLLAWNVLSYAIFLNIFSFLRKAHECHIFISP